MQSERGYWLASTALTFVFSTRYTWSIHLSLSSSSVYAEKSHARCCWWLAFITAENDLTVGRDVLFPGIDDMLKRRNGREIIVFDHEAKDTEKLWR